MPVEGGEMREIMEAQFDVNNKELMRRLHPQTAEPQLPTNRSHRESRLGPRDNEGRIVPEIKLESEDSDSDVQVVSDDECQVIDQKIQPRKKRKPSSGFKDFQYEVPGQQNKKRKEDSEIIDLASSDDEEEPIGNGISEPLSLPVPITKMSQDEKSSSGSGQSSSKDKIDKNQHEVSDDDRPDWHFPASSIDNAEMDTASTKDTSDNSETNKDLLVNEKIVDRNANQNEDVPKVTNDKHKAEPKSNETLINGISTDKDKQDPPEVQVKTFVGQNSGWAVSPAEPKVPEKEEGSKTIEMGKSSNLESSVLPQQVSEINLCKIANMVNLRPISSTFCSGESGSWGGGGGGGGETRISKGYINDETKTKPYCNAGRALPQTPPSLSFIEYLSFFLGISRFRIRCSSSHGHSNGRHNFTS